VNTLIRAIVAAGLVALATSAGAAESKAKAGGPRGEPVKTTLNRVFGPGQWRQTSGYRTPAQEDALRREGAGTVPAGHLSRHSMGGPDAPGAYDVVVPGMSQQSAAVRLRRDGAGLRRVVAERAHGTQGPHLHIEPGPAPASKPASDPGDSVYLRIVGGQRNPVLASR
jgi:hypothetical protein